MAATWLVTLRMLLQAFLRASSIFRRAGALQQALHAYNGMRRMGAPVIYCSKGQPPSSPLPGLQASNEVLFCRCWASRDFFFTAGHRPSNTEFRALMLAATEAAMHGGAPFKRVPLAAGDLPRGFGTATDAAAGPGAGGSSAVAGPDGRLAPVDLHGLSGAEARAAVLTTLSHLQVGCCTYGTACRLASLCTSSNKAQH
jgi:hypothetical protein